MTLYRADNNALDTTTTLADAPSYTTGIKVALQISVPDNVQIKLVEMGWSQAVPTATSTLLKVQTYDGTGATVTTQHSTTTIKPYIINDARPMSMTTGSTATGYGTGALATRTVLRQIAALYVPQTYVFRWPLGEYPVVGSGTAENLLQVVVNTTATTNAFCWLVWDEI